MIWFSPIDWMERTRLRLALGQVWKEKIGVQVLSSCANFLTKVFQIKLGAIDLHQEFKPALV
jgi:hypothetical protein